KAEDGMRDFHVTGVQTCALPISTFVEGQRITFTASASDAQDGDLDADIEWSSSRDGPLGTGASITSTQLSVGTHAVTASVVDSGGLERTAEVSITITARPANAPPTIAISEPPEETSAVEGQPVTFAASATDKEDGNLN